MSDKKYRNRLNDEITYASETLQNPDTGAYYITTYTDADRLSRVFIHEVNPYSKDLVEEAFNARYEEIPE